MPLSIALSIILSGGSLMDLDGTLFIQVGIFFLTMIVLKVLVFDPVMGLFDARDEAIDGAQGKARSLQKEADNAEASFQTEIRKVRSAANEERERMRADGQRRARELTERSRQQAEEMLTAARTRLAQESQRLQADVRASIPVLGSQIADKLLGREANQ